MAFDLGAFLIQFVVIVGGAAASRRLARAVGQPGLIGEIVFGLALGPSLLGWAWPDGFAILFPAGNRPLLEALGWIGLILFIYLVGADLRWSADQARPIFYTALGGLLVPFVLGALLALSRPAWFFPDARPGFQGMILIAVILSVSALPILGGLLSELGYLHRPIGVIAMGASTVDDVVGWVLLAVVAGTGSVGLVGDVNLNLLLVAGVFVAALLIDRYLTPYFAKEAGRRNPFLFVVLLLALFASALVTHEAGLHALLGPFAVGAIISRHPVIKDYAQTRLGEVTSVLFLPAFFVLAGLNTDLRAIANTNGLAAIVTVIVVATAGKVAGAWLGARLAGLPSREGLTIGTLLNARGAVGLVVASVGRDAGFFTEGGYALLVVMIVITTILTPLIASLDTARHDHPAPVEAAPRIP